MRSRLLLAVMPLALYGQAPAISVPPLTKAVVVGQAVSQTVTASGAGLSYQWKRNGQVIAGATGATLNLPSATLADRGWYHVTVTNSAGSATSVHAIDVGLPASTVVSWGSVGAPPADIGTPIAIAAGASGSHVLGLKSNGTVAAWGANFSGEGVVPAGLNEVVALAAGRSSSIALKANGTVTAWGSGIGTVPTGLNDVVAVSLGRSHGLALKADGTVAAWGSDYDGQRNVPAGLRDVVSVAAGGFHSMALLSDGSVVTWGSDSSGQSSVPPNLGQVTAIAAGAQHSLVLRADGTVAAWGQNYSGSTEVPAGLNGVIAIAAGESHNLALKADGTIVAWGRGYENQVLVPVGLAGAGSIAAGGMLSAALIANAAPAIAVQPAGAASVAGNYVSLSATASGTIPLTYQWKKNGAVVANGGTVSGANTATLVLDGVTTADAGNYTVEIANPFGTAISSVAAVSVAIPPALTLRPRTRLATVGQSLTFTVATADPGAISYQWKRNGQIIAGVTGATLTLPTVTMADRGFYEVIVANASAAAVSVFALDVSAAQTAGAIVVPVGDSFNNFLSAGAPAGMSGLVAIAAGENHAAALKEDGTVRAWGTSNFGATNVPAGLADVVAIAVGDYFTLALKADGRVVMWGSYGSNPLVVPAGLRSVVAISAQGGNVLTLKSDGTVVSWSGLPPPPGTNGVITIATGASQNLALKADGTVTVWGYTGSGSQGQSLVPVGLSGVVAIGAGSAHSFAVKADGTVVGWGRNDIGQATVPAGLTNVVAVDGGYVHSMALRADGSVVGWGRDNERQVSDGARLDGVAAISAGGYYNLALMAAGAPVFTHQPVSRIVNAGETITLSAKTTRAPLPVFEWRKDGVVIAGATTNTLTISAIQAANGGAYTATATNSFGSVTSSVATLTVVAPLAVTARPLSRLVAAGQPVSFSIQTTGAVSYQWRRNGEVIAGATNSTFSLPVATLNDQGYYEVVATGGNGATARAVAYLNVAAAQTYLVGWNYDGTAQTAVPGNVRNAVAVPATGSTSALRADGTIATWGNWTPSANGLTDVVAMAAGDGHIIALKDDGTVTVAGGQGYGEASVPAGLDNVVAVAAAGYNSLALRGDGTVVRWGYDYYGMGAVPAGLGNVVAIGAGRHHSAALKSDGTVVAWGRTESGTITAPATLNDAIGLAAGGSSVMVMRRNGTLAVWGGMRAVPAHVTAARAMSIGDNETLVIKPDGMIAAWSTGYLAPVVPAGLANAIGIGQGLALIEGSPSPPVIATQPLSRTVEYGGDVTFSVAATGTPVLNYQWRKNGNVIGFTTPSFTLTRLQPTDAGTYSVTVTNSFGSAISGNAVLTVQSTVVAASGTPVVGGSVTLSVNAPAAATYQWRYRGVPIAGATNATLTLSQLSRGHNGGYDVVLTHPSGSTIAHTYTLDVRPVVMSDLYQPDTAFGPRFETEGAGTILAAVKLADGKFLVGGDFTRLGNAPRLYLARLNADGSIDSSSTLPVLSGPVRALAMHPDGKIYIGGEFSFVDGQRSGGLVRLHANLTVDAGFTVGQGFDAPVLALAAQADGKVIVGGEFFRYGAEYAARLRRLNSDGSVDLSLSYSNSIGPVRALQILPDGKVLIGGGNLGDNSTSPDGYVMRLLPAGGTDWSWNGRTFSGPIFALLREADGRWLVGGGSVYPGGAILQRLSADGADDGSFVFDVGLKSNASRVERMAAVAGGKFIVAGRDLPLSRLSAAGVRDAALPALPYAAGRITALSSEPDGAQRLWGAFSTPAAALAQTGSTTLSGNGESFGAINAHGSRAVAPIFDAQHASGNTVLVRGGFTHVNDVARRGLVRLANDGTVDLSFVAGAALSLANTGRLALRGDGSILVHSGTALLRLAADGTLDPEFTPFSYAAGDVVFDRDGLALLSNGGNGGVFGSTRGLRRLTATGAIDPTFAASSGQVFDLVVQASGRILIGRGSGNITRLFPNGMLDPSFPALNLSRHRLQAAANDRVYILSQESYGTLARLDSTGWDIGFAFPNGGPVAAILPLPDGKLLRAYPPNAEQLNNPTWLLGRHLNNGTADAGFQVSGLDRLRAGIQRMLLLDDGKIWLFGQHLTAFGAHRHGLLRLEPAAAASIATPPVVAQAAPGGTATFTVGASGAGPLTYQWYRNGMILPGATGATLVLTNLTIQDVARYSVKVTNAFNTVESVPVALTGLGAPPTITTQPDSQLTSAGNPATFRVTATAAGALSYQWRRSTFPISGATNATFTIPRASRADAGLYDVVVADGLSLAVSAGVKLDVAPSGYPNTLRPDPSFAPRFEITGGSINAIVPAPGGTFIISGDFSRFNGVERPGLVRIDEAMQVDPAFAPPAVFGDFNPFSFAGIRSTRVHAVQGDGRILVTRALPSIPGHRVRNQLVRLLANGAIDLSFNAASEPENIGQLAVQPDGRILILGSKSSLDSPDRRYVHRLNADGTIDPTYAPNFTSSGSNAAPAFVVALADGRAIFGGGYFDAVNGTAHSGPVRLSAAGVVDSTFRVTGVASPSVQTMAVQPDGRLIVGGQFSPPGHTQYVGRLSQNGAWESGLLGYPDAFGTVQHVRVLADGKILAVSTNGFPNLGIWVTWLSATGIVERKWTGGVLGIEWAVAPVGADRLLVGTHIPTAASFGANGLARIGADGVMEGSLTPIETAGGVRTVAPGAGGKLYVSGEFTRVNGLAHSRLVRLTAQGLVDPAFAVGSGFNQPPQYLLALPDGRLLACGGGFSSYQGVPVAGFVRLRSDGLLDPTFAVASVSGVSPSGPLAVLADGRVMVAGAVALLTDGSRDATFTATEGAFASVALADGGMVVGTTTFNGHSLRRLRADGSSIASVGLPYYTNSFTSFDVSTDGRVVAGGAELFIIGSSGVRLPSVRRFTASLTTDSSFATGSLPMPQFTTSAHRGPRLLLQEDGRILVNDYYGYSRLRVDGTLDPAFALTDVSPIRAGFEARGLDVMLMLDDGRLLIGDRVLAVDGLRSSGLVRFADPAAVMITVPPADHSVVVGEATTFSITASGPGTFTYQWFKNGLAIPGATATTYTIAQTSAGDTGSYSVAVTNSNGTVRSSAGFLTLAPPVAPAITRQPGHQSAQGGQSAAFSVGATGSPAPGFQWRKNGTAIVGATGASLVLQNVQAADAGDYSVVVSNLAGTVTSNTARLVILPAGMSATHAQAGTDYSPGGTVTITNSFGYVGTSPGLTWQVLLPAGWSIASSAGDAGAVKPAAGATDLGEWTWASLPGSPVTFTYTLNVPAAADGDYLLAALVTVHPGGEPLQFLATPDPLFLRRFHRADTNRDGRISLLELTRVIEIYNTRNGTTRTGAYAVALTTSEDGFAPEPTRTGGAVVSLAAYHSADSNQDGKLSLLELTRVIELYNFRARTSRTGQYHTLPGTEDGFAPGP